ncbi:CoA-substrate-specific enzyme activase, putative [Desulfitobacterium dichloroeliminans LMG P-21439]|uniref:CoA-substrate-specific enzyme activase, putative n=1 Tax=Desulfitobacterium dichloroeliminans (strain LMG P-21439 / DCA1) TaxID=871963 RepID=L0F6G1_DESDL|nr:acyl-CoA dehydratase activase [Desulfitobacterium dichloroeliminans]AGA68246.1 CoA-substrate-specific enzyme activase, putative [Desulfitobacterium dichloroeliminans LMG P-21439]
MITVGLDSGNQNTRAVVLKDGKIIGRASGMTEFDAKLAAEKIFGIALASAGVQREEISAVWATGAGRNMVVFADGRINEVGSAARGARFLNPDANLVIDLGAEGCRAIRLTPDGKVKNYEVNDKCASGAGTFIEAMARTLQINIEEMGAYSLRHSKEVPMNAQCVVFAESEVISLIHQQETIEDIAYGIHVGIASRVVSLIRRVGVVEGIQLIGGPGHNEGLVYCMQRELGKEVFVSEETDYISSIGAASYATEYEQKEV